MGYSIEVNSREACQLFKLWSLHSDCEPYIYGKGSSVLTSLLVTNFVTKTSSSLRAPLSAHHLSEREFLSRFPVGIGLLLESPTSGDQAQAQPHRSSNRTKRILEHAISPAEYMPVLENDIKLRTLYCSCFPAQRTPEYKIVIRNSPAIYRLEILGRLSKTTDTPSDCVHP